MSSRFEGIARKRIILHMDVNRTIIQTDIAGGKTLEDVLNNNLASKCYGRVRDGAWVAVRGVTGAAVPGVEPPTESDTVVSYDTFVDEVVAPKPPEMATLAKDKALLLWQDVSAKRRALKKAFTSEGQPGSVFKSDFDQLYKAMHRKDGSEWYIIPSFLHMLNTLSELQWPYTVVFRTFGRDLPEILDAHRDFVLGKTPEMPSSGPLLAAAAKKLDADKPGSSQFDTASLYRPDAEAMFVCKGETAAPPSEDALKYLADKGLKPEKVKLEELFALLTFWEGDEAVQCQSRGFVDYYPWWAANGEDFSAGKVFPVQQNSAASDIFQVFFDDNIFIGDTHSIVDVRDVATGESIRDPQEQAKFLVQCDPYEAIMDREYFVKALVSALGRQQGQKSDAKM